MGVFEKVDAVQASVQAAVEGVQEMKNLISEYGVEQYNKGWDEAMLQAGSVGQTDKIYSEQEMNAIIAEEKKPLEDKILSLDAKILEIQASVQPAVDAAVAAFKAELLAKYNEKQVVESAAETGFADLLK